MSVVNIKFKTYDFETAFDLKVLKIEKIKNAHTNLIYRLDTYGGSTFIARLSETRSAQDLEYEAKLHRYLSIHNVNCPKLIGTKNSYVVRNNDNGIEYPSILMEFVDGPHAESEDDLFLVGQELAKLHQLPIPNFVRKESRMNLESFKRLLLPKEFENFVTQSFIRETVARVESLILTSYKSLCHGDLFSVNSVINENRMFFLDLESMTEEFGLLDLGKTLFGMVTPRTTIIIEKKVNSLLKGYSTLKSLSSNEWNALPLIAALAGIQVAYWRFNFSKQFPNHYDINNELWKEAVSTSINWTQYSI